MPNRTITVMIDGVRNLSPVPVYDVELLLSSTQDVCMCPFCQTGELLPGLTVIGLEGVYRTTMFELNTCPACNMQMFVASTCDKEE